MEESIWKGILHGLFSVSRPQVTPLRACSGRCCLLDLLWHVSWSHTAVWVELRGSSAQMHVPCGGCGLMNLPHTQFLSSCFCIPITGRCSWVYSRWQGNVVCRGGTAAWTCKGLPGVFEMVSTDSECFRKTALGQCQHNRAATQLLLSHVGCELL